MIVVDTVTRGGVDVIVDGGSVTFWVIVWNIVEGACVTVLKLVDILVMLWVAVEVTVTGGCVRICVSKIVLETVDGSCMMMLTIV